MEASKQLAIDAMRSAIGFKLIKGETTEVKKSTMIQLYADNITTYMGIEGVRIKRTPKPVKVESEERYKANPMVKKMFVMTDLINEDCHAFDNLIILN